MGTVPRKGPPENVVISSKHRRKPAKGPTALAKALPSHSKIAGKCAAVRGRRGGGHLYKTLWQVSRHDTPRATPSGGHASDYGSSL